LVDSKNQLNHITILSDNSSSIEPLGLIEINDSVVFIDAIEYPRGTLRVLANNKQYIRSSADSGWQELEENKCTRFISVDDDLYCSFVTKGKEISSPKRKDVTVWIVEILPVFWWKNVEVAKIVLAKETPGGWTIKAVIDQDTDRDAENRFMIESDSYGKIHLLYYASKGGEWNWAAAVGGPSGVGGGVVGDSFYKPELRYAQIDITQLKEHDSSDAHNPALSMESGGKGWISVKGSSVTTLPFPDTINYDYFEKNAPQHPSLNNFTVNKPTGNIEGFFTSTVWANSFEEYRVFLDLKMHNGQWLPFYNIIDRKEFIQEGDIPDKAQILCLRIDSRGNSHAMAIGCNDTMHTVYHRSILDNYHISYIKKVGNRWSAPLMIYNYNSRYYESPIGQLLAIGPNGDLFAIALNSKSELVGRWIRLRADVTE
jgi:hypothetical protein